MQVLSAIIAASALMGGGDAADLTTEYLKPTVSSHECLEIAGLIAAKTTSLGNDGACMQCDPANNVCAPGCQALVDELYVQCDGVTTPDGLYYDPDNSIEGEWSDQVKASIKIATERCGCDGSTRLAPPLPGANVISGGVLAAALTAALSWFAAGSFLASTHQQ